MFKLIQFPGVHSLLLFLHRHLRNRHYLRVSQRWNYFQNSHPNFKTTLDPKLYFSNLITNAEASWHSLQHPQEILWLKSHFISMDQEVPTSRWIKILNHHQPLLFWGIHQGCFEYLHQVICHPSRRVNLITEAAPGDLMSQLRLSQRPNLKIWQSHDFQAAIKQSLKHNEILAFLIDQSAQFRKDQLAESTSNNSITQSKILQVNTGLLSHSICRLNEMGFQSYFISASFDHTGFQLNYTESNWTEEEIIQKVDDNILENPLDFVWHYKWHWPSIH